MLRTILLSLGNLHACRQTCDEKCKYRNFNSLDDKNYCLQHRKPSDHLKRYCLEFVFSFTFYRSIEGIDVLYFFFFWITVGVQMICWNYVSPGSGGGKISVSFIRYDFNDSRSLSTTRNSVDRRKPILVKLYNTTIHLYNVSIRNVK